MPKSTPAFHFINPATPAQGAWCLAVTLIAQADLSKPTTCEVDLDEVFDLSQDGLHARFTVEIIRNAARFRYITYNTPPITAGAEEYFYDETAFKIVPLFSVIHFRGGYPGSIKVTFHSNALPFLRKLQISIHQLLRQNDLTPSSLIAHMRISNSSTVLEMEVLSNPYMIESFSCIEGTPKKWGHQYKEEL